MKLRYILRDLMPLFMLFAFAITMFPFFYVFTRDWNELNYGIVVGCIGLEVLFSVFFTVFTKKSIAKRIIAAVIFTALILVLIFAIPIFYLNTVFIIGSTYAGTLCMAPIGIILAVNAAVRLCGESERKKIPVLRAAVFVMCAVFAALPFRYYLNFAKNEDSVGVYCHNANGVICVQNMIIDCRDKSVELNDTDNSLYQGSNRVYANLIAGRKGISIGDDSSISDYNVFTAKPENGAMKLNVAKESYSLETWQSLGFDTGSAVVPMKVSLNPRTLELTVKSDGAALPEMPQVESFLPGVIGSDRLVYDFFASPRAKGFFGAGALSQLPADGTPVGVDPRCR